MTIIRRFKRAVCAFIYEPPGIPQPLPVCTGSGHTGIGSEYSNTTTPTVRCGICGQHVLADYAWRTVTHPFKEIIK